MLDTPVPHICRLTLYRGICYGPTIQKRRPRLKRGSHSLDSKQVRWWARPQTSTCRSSQQLPMTLLLTQLRLVTLKLRHAYKHKTSVWSTWVISLHHLFTTGLEMARCHERSRSTFFVVSCSRCSSCVKLFKCFYVSTSSVHQPKIWWTWWEKVEVLTLLRTSREVHFHGQHSMQETRYQICPNIRKWPT